MIFCLQTSQFTIMYLTLKRNATLTTCSIQSESIYKVVIHVTGSAKESGNKSYHTRIPFGFRSMPKISAEKKWLPLSNQGFSHILFATCEVSNYVIGIPIQKVNGVTISEGLVV